MKKLLLIAVAALVVLGAGVLLVRQDQTNQNTKINSAQNETAVAVSAALEQAQANYQVERQSFVAQIDEARLNCERGKAAWDELSTFQKRGMEEPKCPTPIVVESN